MAKCKALTGSATKGLKSIKHAKKQLLNQMLHDECYKYGPDLAAKMRNIPQESRKSAEKPRNCSNSAVTKCMSW